MSERITRRTEWDGTFTLLLDNQVVLERRSLGEVEEKKKVLEIALILGVDTKRPV